MAREKQRNGEMVIVAALTGLLGLLVGFTFGYVHGLHASPRQPQRAPCPALPSCPAVERLAEAESRISLLEDAHKQPVAEEVLEYGRDLETQVEQLQAQLKEQDAPDSSSDLGRTHWRQVEAVKRDELWGKVLPGFPYAAGASTSRDALVFSGKTRGCEEYNVVVASNKQGVCLAVFDSRLPMYTMLRIDNSKGKLLEEERKKTAPRKHVPAPSDAYSPERLQKRALVLSQADTLPKNFALKESLEATSSFGLEAQRLVKDVKALIVQRKIAERNKTVVVMATNQGTLDLVANFVCSCRSAGLAAALRSVLVFAADGATRDAVEALGISSFHDSALGALPTEAAKTYGDYNFVRMMWLKVTAVYLVVAGQHSVLFQDADVVWLRNPLDFFAHEADPYVDTFWMDDGARSMRYTPFYANSGFYLLRYNDRVLYFMHRLMMSYDNILAVRSHQHALIMLLLEHVGKHGLSVNVLPFDAFPQGQVFHHKKTLMQDIVDGQVPAWVFHMCWTAGRVDKLVYMKNMGLWFLKPTCTIDSWRDENNHTADSCCLNVKAFQAPTPYTDTITIQSKDSKKKR